MKEFMCPLSSEVFEDADSNESRKAAGTLNLQQHGTWLQDNTIFKH